MLGTPNNPGAFAPRANFVGWRTADTCPVGLDWWAEPTWPRHWPRNLHESMVATRAARLGLDEP